MGGPSAPFTFLTYFLRMAAVLDTAFALLRSLWTSFNDLGKVLDVAKEAASSCSSLAQLLQSLAGRPELLKLVATQASSLTSLLRAAMVIASEASAAVAARKTWGGFALAVVTSPFSDASDLAIKVNDVNTRLTQATAALSAAIGVQTYAAMAQGARSAAAAGAAASAQLHELSGMVSSQASQLDKLNAMVERLTLALAHEGATPAASKELAFLRTAASAGAADPHSPLVSTALRNSRDLYAEVESAALARFFSRGQAANSIVLQAPTLQLSDLADWSPQGAHMVGAGSYGHVRRGLLREFGLPVAVKTLPQAIVAEACKTEAGLGHLLRGIRREADIRECAPAPALPCRRSTGI